MEPRQLEQAEKDRLWQHVLHEDTLYYERLNSFLVMQGLMLASVGFSEGPFALMTIRIFCFGGPILCILALIGLLKQHHLVNFLDDRCNRNLLEFAETRKELERHRWRRRLPGRFLTSILVPLIILIVWIQIGIIVPGESVSDLSPAASADVPIPSE
jgi:hypothetical protein